MSLLWSDVCERAIERSFLSFPSVKCFCVRVLGFLRASQTRPRSLMRPKTFPAAPYVGNTRQRLLDIKAGLKQPAKLVSQALHGGSSRAEGGRGGDSKGKDQAGRQQQLRQPQKFNNYQNALREIRKSLRPFECPDVNKQMLQDLVNAGCDQVSGRIFLLI